jgi:hypothetical protein
MGLFVKIILTIWFGLSILISLSSGIKDKEERTVANVVIEILYTLFLIGIWVWL